VTSIVRANICAVAPQRIVEQGSAKANDPELPERLMKLTKEVVDQKSNASAKGCPLNMA